MKIYKLNILIIFLFLTACGYKIANNIEDYKFNISNYELTGNKKINNILVEILKDLKKMKIYRKNTK